MTDHINGAFSKWLPVLSGVPQGSMLSPLSFLLYIGNIHHCVSHCSIQMFVNDFALYKEITSPSDQDLLQADLIQVYT